MKRAARRLLRLVLASALFVSLARAEVNVPANVQAQLAAKIVDFDRHFVGRAGQNALVLVVFKPGDSDSTLLARQVAAAFGDVSDLGGLPKTVEVVGFSGAAELSATCRERRAALVYVSAGLERDAPAIAAALAGGDVLTIGASAAHAENGIVVGFDLDGGRPKILVNIAAARAQNVAFKAEFLKLARVVGKT